MWRQHRHHQILLRPPSSNRREPLLKLKQSFSGASRSPAPAPVPAKQQGGGGCGGGAITKVHVAEAIGSTAAECAAVWCCCPCGIVNLLVLAVYRVPASLCRKVWRRRRRQRLIKKGLLSAKGRRLSCGCDEGDMKAAVAAKEELVFVLRKKDEVDEQLEKEMWDRFYNTGFWRSPSQREQKKIENQ